MSDYVSFDKSDGSGLLPLKQPYEITKISNAIKVVKYGQLVIVYITNWLDINVTTTWIDVEITTLPYKPIIASSGSYTTANSTYTELALYVTEEGKLCYTATKAGNFSITGQVVYITND